MDEQKIIAEYENTNEEGKKLLLRIFDEGIFVKKFVKKPEWIQLWDRFCLENNLNIRLPNSRPETPEEEYDNASVMLRNIVDVKIRLWSKENGKPKWIPNWNDENERKFYPRFDMRDKNVGGLFGFTIATYVYWATHSYSGSRLCYPTAELCEKTAIEFLPIYEKFFKQ